MDYQRPNKPKVPTCMLKGPGPRYMLKNLTGYDEHDPSRLRSPAYTMKFRHKPLKGFTVPGPYTISQHLTHKGFELPPAYTMTFKPPQKIKGGSPGPGAYAPENCPPVNHQRRAAAYSLVFRKQKVQYPPGPGPIYMLPTCIGPEIPDIKAEAAFTMRFREKHPIKSIGPGPAAYNIKLSTIKKQCPAYSIKNRHDTKYFSSTPGPVYSYDTNLIKKKSPTYSFGVKYSECTTVGFTDDDS